MRIEFGLAPSGSLIANLRSRQSAERRICALALTVGLGLLLTACEKKKAQAGTAPPEVTVADVLQQDVPEYGEWVAQLDGPVNAEITPKIHGYLLRQNYINGSLVRKGQLLFEIDPRPFEAALDQAKADEEKAQSSLTRATNDVVRDTPLAAQRAIPAKQLDDDRANETWAKAQVAAAQAQQQQAELNLGWTKVYSPVDGIAGVANSQVGDLVGTTTKMTTVSQIDPIWAYFNISERLYFSFAPQISRILQKGEVKGNLPVQYIQANDAPYPFKGDIIFANRQITAGTGTIQLAAAFQNKDLILRPGGFGRVRVQTGTVKNALLVPQSAVSEVQSLYQLFVVTPDNKAVVRPVKVGERVGPNWIITDGLHGGERVIVDGIQRVQTFAAQAPDSAKQGVPVIPKPYVATASN
jgi:RND family efflux transporter MFP subunit